jgi:O-antigen ligase
VLSSPGRGAGSRAPVRGLPLVALALAAPNLIWQATHGLPMALVAANIASGGSTSSTPRVALLPSVLLAVGPVVCIVLIVGLIVLLRTRERRSVDGWLAAGFLIFLVFLLITGGKAYYPAAFYPALLAAGAGPVLDWIRIRMWRRVLAIALVIISLVITPSLMVAVHTVNKRPAHARFAPSCRGALASFRSS